MKLSRRQLLGVLGLGLFAGGTIVPKVLVSDAKPVFEHGQFSLYMSRECYEDIMTWNVDQVDEQTKREILSYNG